MLWLRFDESRTVAIPVNSLVMGKLHDACVGHLYYLKTLPTWALSPSAVFGTKTHIYKPNFQPHNHPGNINNSIEYQTRILNLHLYILSLLHLCIIVTLLSY